MVRLHDRDHLTDQVRPGLQVADGDCEARLKLVRFQGSSQLLLEIYPDLRPLKQAAEGQSLKSIGSTPPNSARKTSQGTLKVRLTSTSTMRLNEGGRGGIQLQAAKGELVMDLRGPWSLRLTGPPGTSRGAIWGTAGTGDGAPRPP